ncbi:MAG: hypothetical protein Kow0031_29200 [Anaerolineae bacterium]
MIDIIGGFRRAGRHQIQVFLYLQAVHLRPLRHLVKLLTGHNLAAPDHQQFTRHDRLVGKHAIATLMGVGFGFQFG